MEALRKSLPHLAENVQAEAEELIKREREILDSLLKVTGHKFLAVKSRIHGNYHLGQLLYTGDDFYFSDFEGDPAKPLSERRLKHSPLLDVAALMYSFYHVAFTTLANSPQVRGEDKALLEPWAWLWYRHNSGIFLDAYRKSMENGSLVPQVHDDFKILLTAYMLNKTLNEIDYELNRHSEWVVIPLRVLLDLIERG